MARKQLLAVTKAARQEQKRFQEAYAKYLAQSRNVSLTVLVWGQNPRARTPLAKKRKQIRRELRKRGHNALFSEEISPQIDGVSEKTKEFAQARAANLIIILIEDAPGASAEAHDFCNDPDIAPNVYVMVPTRYKEGYSAKGAIKDLDDGYGGVFWYGDGDLASCAVLTKAVQRAEARRQLLFRAGRTP